MHRILTITVTGRTASAGHLRKCCRNSILYSVLLSGTMQATLHNYHYLTYASQNMQSAHKLRQPTRMLQHIVTQGSKTRALKKAQPCGFFEFYWVFWGTGFYWVFWRGFKVWVASAKCYSHQVNPETKNDYCVFIVNYVYCLCTGTVLIIWKLHWIYKLWMWILFS